MPEARSARKKRLQAAGVWKDFLADRKALMAEHPKWAAHQIDVVMTEKYADVEAPEGPDGERIENAADGEAEDTIDPTPDGPQKQFRREDVEWVYQNLDTDASRADAPSPGAFGLREWAKKPGNKGEFYRNFLAKLLPSKAQVDADAARIDDGSSCEDTCRTLLREIADECGDEKSNEASGPQADPGHESVSDGEPAGSDPEAE